jgi:hypothetical protein
MKSLRTCSAYFRGSDIYTLASAQNVFGIRLDSEPMVKLSHPVAPAELGNTVMTALDAFRTGVPGRTYVRGVKGHDIVDSDWRPLDLQAQPFSCPAPLETIVEQCQEGDAAYADKSLLVWPVNRLPKMPTVAKFERYT